MSNRVLILLGAAASLSLGSLLTPVPAQAENVMNFMNPSKWFGGNKDRDYYGYPGYGYGYPGYGYGYPGYGGWGGYPGYGGWGGYPGYGGWGGYPGYGGYGYGAPANNNTPAPAPVPQ